MSNNTAKTIGTPGREDRLRAAAKILARGAIRLAAAELAQKKEMPGEPEQIDEAHGSDAER